MLFDFSIQNKTLKNNVIFRDIHTNFKVDSKDLLTSDNLEGINNSLRNIFAFNKGEHILLPEFGCSLYQFLYEPINNNTANRIVMELGQMFEIWEPRINILNINVIPNAEQNEFHIELEYDIPALNQDNKYTFETSLVSET